LGDAAEPVMAEVFSRMGHRRGPQAIQAFAEMPIEFQLRWRGLVAAGMSSQAPELAAELWAHASPDELDTAEAQIVTDRIAERFIRADRLKASEWLGHLPIGQARDRAALKLVEYSAGDDPETAALWVATIQDDELRASAERTLQQGKDRNLNRKARPQ
jgi:hypothetical protein